MKSRVIQDEPERRATVTEPRPGVAAWVRDHRLTTFFVLAFVLAWWFWPLYHLDIWPRQAFHAVGALLAAVIVIAVADGRAGFRDLGRRMIRWRVPWYFYAFALGLPLVVRFAATLVNDAPAPDWTGWLGIPATFSITIVYVWLFYRTGGSVLLVLLFHNAQGFVTMGDLGYGGAGLARQELIEFVAWSLVAVALVAFDRAAWRSDPRVGP
jgi:hypothetical protein